MSTPPRPQVRIAPVRTPRPQVQIAPVRTLQYVDHEPRDTYAQRIRDVAAYYFDNQNAWVPGPCSREVDVVLVEVWERNKKFEIHPSRNQFFLVSPSQQVEWHCLALNPRTEEIRKYHAVKVNQPGPSAPAAHPSPQIPVKLSKPPSWAQEGNVIGYTCSMLIGDPSFEALRDLRRTGWTRSLPSVYYRLGHKTNDHEKEANIGWDDKTGWQRLFFGNVPSVCAQK